MRTEITHAEFLAAIEPLLELIGVTSNEVLSTVLITPSDGAAIANIDLLVAARARGDERPKPRMVRDVGDLLPPADPAAVFVWPLRVAVR